MKKALMRFFAVIICVCSVALAASLSACGNKDKYYKVSYSTGNLPEQIISVDLSSNMSTNDVPYYLESKEEGQNFIGFHVTCRLGFEPDLTVKTNNSTLSLSFNREDIMFLDLYMKDGEVLAEDTEGAEKVSTARYYCPIDNSKLSGEEQLTVTGGVKAAYYPVSLTVFENLAPKLGNYENLTVTINAQAFTFEDFTFNPEKKAIVPYDKPFTVTVKVAGKTFAEEDGNYICSPVWTANWEQVMYPGEKLFKVEGDSISYQVIFRGQGTLFIDLPFLNNLYQ